MRKLVERVLERVHRLADDQIRSLLSTLSEENATLEAALDSMSEGILILDESHVPLMVNKATERLIPCRINAAAELPVWEHVEDEPLALFLRESLEREDTVSGREFPVEHLGAHRIVALYTTPLLKDRKIAGTIVLFDDITDRKRDELRLRRAESLASLTTLAAGVAHEIKNPLGSLSIRVQLLRKAMRAKELPSKETMEGHLAVIEEEMERLNRIVVDFLFAVRPVNVQPLDSDPNALVREIAELMAPEIERAGIALSLDLADPAPIVPLDTRYMKQALLNLVKNSLAATGPGGALELSTSLQDGELRLGVEDDGEGIPSEHLSKIFEPYFTTKENGTGLGLTLTYKIVKEHGGDVSVVSESGKGTKVVVSIPVPQRGRKLISDGTEAE
jgi:PAS domain S-box-containing protein